MLILYLNQCQFMNVITLCNLILCFGKYNSPCEPQSHILKCVVIQSPNDRRLESHNPDPFTSLMGAGLPINLWHWDYSHSSLVKFYMGTSLYHVLWPCLQTAFAWLRLAPSIPMQFITGEAPFSTCPEDLL